ncbi:MAG: Spy/CpxP family protein refolding chaperone [bacterium]
MNRIITLYLLLALMSVPLQAQEEPLDPIDQYTFEPELVMQNQRAIALTEQQRTSIKKEIQVAQAKFTELEWDLQSEMESFISLLRKERVDERRALDVLKKVLALESEIKQTHLVLAIRLKNLLTAEQQEKLRKLRNQMHEERNDE